MARIKIRVTWPVGIHTFISNLLFALDLRHAFNQECLFLGLISQIKKLKKKKKKKELNPYKNRQKCVNKKISTIKSYRKSLP